MTDAVLSGECLCGAVKITVAGAHDPSIGACHCRICQQWSGGIFVCFEAVADAVTVSGDVVRFASSDFAERAFCPRCGSHLWMRDTDGPGKSYDLMPGLFDAARDWTLRSEIYADCAMVPLAGDHLRATAVEYELKNKSVEGDT